MRTAEGIFPMAPERVERKRVTIFAASVEGYLPFMCAGSEATRKTLGDYREIINTLMSGMISGSVRDSYSGGTLLAETQLGRASTATELRCRVDTADQGTGRTRCRQH